MDFAFILVVLTAVTGVIWALELAVLRRRRLQRRGGQAKEPWPVEYSRSLFPVILLVLLVRSFLAEPFRIPSSSMMPTLLIGDFILVNKYTYGLRLPVLDTKFIEIGEPERGDIVVFRFPRDPSQDYIKRVVGLPGDEIVYRDKQLTVNGQPIPTEQVGRYIGEGSGREMTGAELKRELLPGATHQILERPNAFFGGRGEGIWKVPEGHYFVMGDNRDNSEDSRYWGYVPERNLVGKAFFIWMNWDSRNGGIDFDRVFSSVE
ncbi:MAG TPA: signal peptidase I [Xanthomonadaceae bacterium]|nr:signal peptidase I [Xanthomonadaceae bacterium]